MLIAATILGVLIAIANSNNRRERERQVMMVERADGQWSDQRYADARQAMGAAVRASAPVTGEAMPPISADRSPARSSPDTIDGDIGG